MELKRSTNNSITVQIAASSVGAPHERKRYWMVAYSDGHGKPSMRVNAEMARSSPIETSYQWRVHRSELLGVDDGISNRVDRFRATGNAQVPAVARLAWETLK
jgi:DNA (cytosine-5)-methyltransferase 1